MNTRTRVFRACQPPFAQQRQVAVGNERQIVDGPIDVLRHNLQQLNQTREPLRDGGGREQIRVVLALQGDAAVHFDRVQEYLEVFEAPGIAGHAYVKPLELQVVPPKALFQIEDHRHQRQPSRVAGKRQPLEKGTERELLMFHGVEHDASHPRQQRPEGVGPGYASAHGDQIHTMSNEVVVTVDGLTRGRNAHHEIVL
ncbi:MAG: hypothetical protein ABIQ52_16635 [Vicinamibacterales bacterium]